MTQTSYIHLLSKSRMMELYLHSSIQLTCTRVISAMHCVCTLPHPPRADVGLRVTVYTSGPTLSASSESTWAPDRHTLSLVPWLIE
jgi:hypothetical protein